jgi:acetyl esterase/lipase
MAMTSVHDYPPIDRELADTVWPMMIELQKAQANLSDEEFQAQIAAGVSFWQPDVERGGAVRVEETTIPSASGAQELPVLVLRPATGSGPLPCIYYIANSAMMQQGSRVGVTDLEPQWVADLGVAFVSISPRVGPVHPYPAQVEDAYAGLLWITEHADELEIDPARIILMGKSGGGGVAAATALYARDHSGPQVTHQMLMYPMIDDRKITVSDHFDVAPWTASDNRIGWAAILGSAAGGPDVSPYAAAARATNLTGLPSAYLEVGSSEVFRDQTLDYAARLAQAGTPIEVHSWNGGFHGFELVAPNADISRAALATRTSYLRRALRSTAPGNESLTGHGQPTSPGNIQT